MDINRIIKNYFFKQLSISNLTFPIPSANLPLSLKLSLWSKQVLIYIWQGAGPLPASLSLYDVKKSSCTAAKHWFSSGVPSQSQQPALHFLKLLIHVSFSRPEDSYCSGEQKAGVAVFHPATNFFPPPHCSCASLCSAFQTRCVREHNAQGKVNVCLDFVRKRDFFFVLYLN